MRFIETKPIILHKKGFVFSVPTPSSPRPPNRAPIPGDQVLARPYVAEDLQLSAWSKGQAGQVKQREMLLKTAVNSPKGL